MERVQIKYDSEVVHFLNQLAFKLFEKDYFSYFDNAVVYKDKIIDFIENNLPHFPSKKTPLKVKYLGQNYIFYTSNQRTTWYVFFEKENNNYLITNIINNHSEEANWLI